MNNIQSHIFQNSSSLNDPNCQTDLLAFVNELRSSDVGWQMCVESLTNGEIQDDRLKFLGLQVIEYFLKNSYSKASLREQEILRNFLSRWIQVKCIQHNVHDPVFVRNKAAQVFALTCVQDFPLRWPTFFSDLIDTLSLGPQAVDHFLRVLKAIDSEIADREITYTQNEVERNTVIKNAMRETCIEKLVSSLCDILTNYELSNPELASHCLEILSTYIHWIDIGLVANDHFISILLRMLTLPATREAAAVCVLSIVSKGMDPLEKFRLVESLMPVLSSVGVFNLATNDESDFCCKLAHLVNGIGLAVIDSFNKLQKNGHSDQLNVIGQSIDAKIPVMITFLANDYDDVSGAVLDFTKEYIHILKTKTSLSVGQVKIIHQILVTVIHKMKYDISYQFDNEGEDEAEFQEFRKSLKVIFDNLVGLNKSLVLEYISDLVTHTLLDWRSSSFADVEISLATLFYVSESLPTQAGNHLPEDHAQVQALVHLVLNSGVSGHPHSSVCLQFLELIVRYERLLLPDSSCILSVIFIFLGSGGLRHQSSKVRSRSAYLFSKFIKGAKSVIGTYTKDILVPLEELLVLNDPANHEKQELMSQDDQLFLFEAAGILIISSSLSNEGKVGAFRDLLLPIIKKFDRLLKQLSIETDIKQQENIANLLSHAISITTRTSKAFTQQTPMKSIGCVPVYIECLVMFLASLQIPIQMAVIQNSVRQFLHRMVVCLDVEILPYIPRASQSLLKNNDIRSMQEYIPLLVQITAKFQKEVAPFLQEYLTPIVSAIFACLAVPLEEGDEDGKVEKNTLKRLYFQFISAVVTHVVDALQGQHALVQKEILSTVTQGAADSHDPVMQKSCFSILRKFVELWGNRESTDEFVQFMWQSIIRVCFEAPVGNMFDTSGGVSAAVVGESALCLKAIYNKRGDEMIAYLENTYLPSVQLSSQKIKEYIFALKSDIKTFKAFLKNFYHLNS